MSLRIRCLCGFLLLCMLTLGVRAELQDLFLNPPDAARPWVYWYFMDGNLTREGMKADLESMVEAGIGGVLYLEVDIGIPRGPVSYMSPEWQELLQEAIKEADELGVEVSLGVGPGWCGSGGPWVKPEHAMQHTVAAEQVVEGPARFDGILARPKPRNPFFGVRTLTPKLRKEWENFYEDVAVVAYPTPSGNAILSDSDEKAVYQRAPFSSRRGVKPYLAEPVKYSERPEEECVRLQRVVDLTGKLAADGRLVWDVPPGSWTIMRFGRTLTGQTTRPAPQPGLGFECDKFTTESIEAHLEEVVTKLLKGRKTKPRPGRGWTTLHLDSWEMSAQNGAINFLPEFRKRRGYDPTPFLPAMAGKIVGSVEVTERFLWDLRQTAQELIIDNYIGSIKKYAGKHGLLYSNEPYDMNPCSDLEMGSLADVPMCEFWSKGHGLHSEYSCFEAVSIAHTAGKRIVGAEAFTSNHSDSWRQHPASMKAQGDWALCLGINRFVFHRYQAQPRLDQWPGMTMGPYGVYWERTQTWWPMVDAYHRYLTRCQAMMRQGVAVADVLYLVPEGAPHIFQPPVSATDGDLPDFRGYTFDGCAPGVFMKRAAVRDGEIVFPDGMSYKLLVLPRSPSMSVALLRKIADMVEQGATVVGYPPVRSLGLSGYPKSDQKVRELVGHLWGNSPDAGERKIGKGRIILDKEAGQSVPYNPMEQAEWIWYPEGNPVVAAPVATRHFIREFTLEQGKEVILAQISITADNGFRVELNGNPVGKGENFHKVYAYDVTPWLKPGKNKLGVAAFNTGHAPNPAGLIAALTIRFKDGGELIVNSDSKWLSGIEPGQVDKQVVVLGGYNMSPWGMRAPKPELYPDYFFTSAVLREMNIAPDFACNASVRYGHRRTGEEDFYFIANREEQVSELTACFRVAGREPEWWDPNTGECRKLPEFTTAEGVTSIPLRLEPLESGFVVFRKSAESKSGGGRNIVELKQLMELGGEWKVAFDPKWGGPTATVFSTLLDWSQHTDEGIRYYSGVATYTKRFHVANDVLAADSKGLFIDLGSVKNLASASLNGRELGKLWCAPWRLRVPADVVKQGENLLEIKVANLWINRLIKDASLPEGERLTTTTRNPYGANAPLQPSGLLGPVLLLGVN